MNKINLQVLLKAIVNTETNAEKSFFVDVSNLSILKLRDIIIVLGKIIYEDLNEGVYIVEMKGGLLKKNPAYAALHLDDDTLQITIIAKEGIINQRTCEGVANEITRSLKKHTHEK